MQYSCESSGTVPKIQSNPPVQQDQSAWERLRNGTTPDKLIDDFFTLDNQKYNVAQVVKNVL